MAAYYNEVDPYAAQYLRNLIDAGHIAQGVVDERSIVDVQPNDLIGYTQCHFFAGIGIWSYALRQANWADDRPIWTGSCPCQPFSGAGKGKGFDDERHLWPHFHRLISECRPATVLGEQVASKNAEPWLDLVQVDLETMGYAFGCLAFPAAGVGAPHLRDRAYWVGHASSERLEGFARHDGSEGWSRPSGSVTPSSVFSGMANTVKHDSRSQATPTDHRESAGDRPADWPGGRCGSLGELAYTNQHGRSARRERSEAMGQGQAAQSNSGIGNRPGPVNGYWRDADWIYCRDGKWRPVEPGTSPLAPRSPGHVGRLRAYGNGLCAQAAQVFIECVKETI